MMEEKKKFEVDELGNEGYKKESKVGKIIIKIGTGALALGGLVIGFIISGSSKKEE